MGRGGRIAWFLVAGFLLLLLVRLLHGGRPGPPPDPVWGLRVLWHHGTAPQALALAGVLACVAAIAWAAGRLARRDDPLRPLSWGAVLFFAVGVVDAVAGAYLHFRPVIPTSFAPWILLAARSAALAVALPALFLRLRGLGTAFVAPGLALTLLGVGLFLSPLEAAARPRRGNDPAVRLVAAGLALEELREGHPALRDLRRRVVAAGEDGVDALLDSPSSDVWWTWSMLLDFGRDQVPALLRGLSRPDPSARQRALRALAAFAHERDVALAVLPLLSDPDTWVRCFAARFFDDGSDNPAQRTAAVGLPEAVEALRALLRDPESGVRHAAVAALRHQGPHAAWPDLRKLLRFEPDRQVREEAHTSLLKMRTPDAFRLLLQDASKDCSHGGSLPYPVDAAWVEVAVEALDSPHARQFLVSDLYGEIRLPDRLIRRLLDAAMSKDAEVRRAALSTLSRVDDPRAFERCRAALDSSDRAWILISPQRIDSAHDILLCLNPSKLGPEDAHLADPIEARLHDPGASRREVGFGLWALRNIDPERAARTAMCLYEREPNVGLIHFFPPADLARLLDAPDPIVSLAALRSLGSAEDPRAARRLVKALRDAAPNNRWDLIRMAARSRVRDAVPVLCEIAAQDPPPGRQGLEAHTPVAVALGEIGDPAAVETLRDLQRRAEERNHPRLKAETAIALLNSGDRSVLPSLRGLSFHEGGCACGSGIVCRAMRALAAAGEVGALLDAAEDPRARVAAIEALGMSKSPRARPALLERLAHARPDIRRAAAFGLGHLADPETAADIRKAVDDPSPLVGKAARWALQQITGEDAGLRMSSHRPHTFEER